MEHFQNAVNKFPPDKTNLTRENYGFTIEELYNMAKPYLEVIHSEFKFTNIIIIFITHCFYCYISILTIYIYLYLDRILY